MDTSTQQLNQPVVNNRKLSFIDTGKNAMNLSFGSPDKLNYSSINNLAQNDQISQIINNYQSKLSDNSILTKQSTSDLTALQNITRNYNLNQKLSQSPSTLSFINKRDMSLGVSTFNGSPQKQLNNIKNLLIKKKNMTLPEAAENEEIIGQLNSEKIKSIAKKFKEHKGSLSNNPFKKEFMRILESEFTLSQNAHQLIELLAQRFQIRPLSDDNQSQDQLQSKKVEIDILSLLICLVLLARIVYDKKLRLLFEIFDEDEDGCIKPKDILRMFIKTEKLQIYYNPSYDHLDTLNLPSTQRHQSYQMIDASGSHQKKNYKNRNKQNYIYNMIIAEKKAEQSFNFVSGMIQHQFNQKQQQIKNNMSNIKEKELILKKVETFELHNDQLITYREFMDAIKGLKDSLYKNIIPRILTFNDLFRVMMPPDKQHESLSSDSVDQYAFFKYELYSILNKPSNNSDLKTRNQLLQHGNSGLSHTLINNTSPQKVVNDQSDFFFTSPDSILQQSSKFQKSKKNDNVLTNLKNLHQHQKLQSIQEYQSKTNKQLLDSPSTNQTKVNNNNASQLTQNNMYSLNLEEIQRLDIRNIDKYFKDIEKAKTDQLINKFQQNASSKLGKMRDAVQSDRTQIAAMRMEELSLYGKIAGNQGQIKLPLINQEALKQEILLEKIKQEFQ